MDSPLMASEPQGAESNGPIAAMLANRNVHDRLYAGSPPDKKPRMKDAREAKEAESRKPEKRLGAATEACLRLHAEGVEQKKEVLKKAREKQDEEFRDDHPFQPTTTQTPLWKPEKISGTRKEAWQRLQKSNSQKEVSLKESREKLHQEFQEAHPFKPNMNPASPKLKFAPKPLPPTTQEEWIQMQKDWQKKKLEKRSEKLRLKREEEEKEVQEQNVHRNVEADAAAVCKRLHQQHARQQERQHKRRVEHFAEANENLNRLHRELDKTAVASQKVDQMVERLYILDRENRNERQQQRMKQKKKAEQAEELLLEALSVHSPPGIKNDYHHDQVSMRIAKELEQLRAQVAELQQRARRTDYKELAKSQAKPKTKSKSRSKSKEVAPRVRSVSPSYAALAAKKPGSAAAKQSAAPPRSPATKPAPSAAMPQRTASPRPKSVGARPAATKPGSSPGRPKSPAKESKGAPKARSQSKPLRAASPSGASSSVARDSFADHVRAANDRRNSGSSASQRSRSSSAQRRRASPGSRRNSSASQRSSSGSGKPLEPKRLRAPSTSSTGESPSVAPTETAAAVKIQSRVRGKQARQEAQRRRQAFGARSETKNLTEDESEEQRKSLEGEDVANERQKEIAATKIQSQIRGKQARLEADRRRQAFGRARSETQGLDADRSDDEDAQVTKSQEEQDLSDEGRREQAATRIQSRVRGNQVRRDMKQRFTKQTETRSQGSQRSNGSGSDRDDRDSIDRSSSKDGASGDERGDPGDDA